MHADMEKRGKEKRPIQPRQTASSFSSASTTTTLVSLFQLTVSTCAFARARAQEKKIHFGRTKETRTRGGEVLARACECACLCPLLPLLFSSSLAYRFFLVRPTLLLSFLAAPSQFTLHLPTFLLLHFLPTTF